LLDKLFRRVGENKELNNTHNFDHLFIIILIPLGIPPLTSEIREIIAQLKSREDCEWGWMFGLFLFLYFFEEVKLTF